jgi:Domain of unknown function (DUF4397)
MTAKKLALLFCSLLIATLLAACGGDDSDSAEVRILNASLDYGAVDIYFDDELKHSNVAAGAMSGYLDFKSESKTLRVTRSGSQSAILETSASPGKGTKHLYVLYGGESNLRLNQYSENESEAGSEKTKVRLLNLSADAGPIDFFASTSSTNVNDQVARTSGIGYGGVTAWQELDRGTYRGWFTAASDKTDIRLEVPSIVLEDKKQLTIVLMPTIGGTLLNAQVFNQQGEPTKTENTNSRLRLVAGLSATERVTVRTAENQNLLSNSSPSISSYILVPKGATTLNVAANGVAFATVSADLVAGTDNTLLTYGAPAADGTQSSGSAKLLRDNNRAPAQSTRAKVKLVNGFVESNGGLTLSADYSPVVSNVALGSASDYGLVTGGIYSRLDVTEASGSTPVYLEEDVTFANGSVYSLFVMGKRSAPVGILRKDR